MMAGKENLGNQNIAVYADFRFIIRPLKALQERKAVDVNCLTREITIIEKHKKPVKFDRVFDSSSTQADLYKAVSPFLDDVLQGFSCTIIAYGQTGSGKSYTMTGERSCSRQTSWEEDPALLPTQ